MRLLTNHFTYRSVLGIITTMKHVQLLAVVSVGLALAGCAGGGNVVVPVSGLTFVKGPRVESVVSRTGIPLTDTSGNLEVQDPRNFETSMEFTFQLAAYTADGTRYVLDPDRWVSTDSTSLYGSLAANSGLFSTFNSVTSTNQVMTAVYQGKMFSAEYAVTPRGTVLVGRVLDEATNKPVADANISFYDKDGGLITTVTSSSFGTYRASLPSGATQFQVDGESLPSTSWRVYGYNGRHYAAGSVDCRAPVSSSNLLPGIVYLNSSFDILVSPKSSIAPDTDGCTG